MSVTTIGPFDVHDATTDQLAVVTEAWSYCTFPIGKINGQVNMYFELPPVNPATGKHAWGETYVSAGQRKIQVNPNKTAAEQRYVCIHELGHIVDFDRLNATTKAQIDLYLSPDFGYYDQVTKTGWNKGPYRYNSNECFAHGFSKGLYVSGGYTWQNVLTGTSTYKRLFSPSDYTALKTIIENSSPDGTSGDVSDTPEGETRTYLTTKDAGVVISNSYTPVDVAGGASNWNSSMFDGFNGSDPHHPIGKLRSTDTPWFGRAFLYFPISFTGAQTVDSAILWVNQRPRGSGHAWAAVGGNVSIYVARMTNDFGETPKKGESTWFQSSSNQWSFRKTAQRYSSTDASQNWTTQNRVTKTFVQADDGWVPIDITDIAQAWFDHSKGLRNDAPNYGLLIMAVDETDNTKAVDIFSREASDATRIPYIDVTINANVAPTVPTALTPTGGALQNTLSPVLSGQANDADPGDYISGVQVKVFKNDGTTLLWDSGTINVTGQPSTFNVTYGQQVGITPPAALVGNTLYKWQVRTSDKANAWSPWSALQQFKVNTPPLAPTVTLVETPLSDVKSSTPTVVITHNDSDPGDTLMYGYQFDVQYSGTTIYSSGPVDLASIDRATTKSTVMPTLTPPDGNPWGKAYKIRARTKDSNAAWGAFGPWIDFTTHLALPPISLDPSADTTIASATPTFLGTRASSGDIITGYQIILYDDSLNQVWDSGLISTGISSGTTFSKTYTGTALSTGTFYQWKVLVVSSIGGTSAFSALQRFKTPSDVTVPAPTAPLGNGIVGGGSNALRPAFTASRASAFIRYQIQVYPSTSTIGNLGTAIYDSGTVSQGSATTLTMAADTVTALSWATQYKWRVRVASDTVPTWSAWSGLAAFTMDAAGTPTLSSPTSDQWITDSTPDLTIARAGSDTIDQMQVRVYAENSTTLIWDSGMTDVTNGSSALITYAGPTLTGGYYWWDARYQKSTGPIGNYSSKQRFRLNFAPDIPTSLRPLPGEVLEETLIPVFEAKFSDADVAAVGDLPAEWEIIIEVVSPNSVVTTKSITTSLVVGVNQYTYSGSPALSYSVDYQWKTRFKDSKGVWGAYSGYQTFRASVKPNTTDLLPSNTSTVNSLRPSTTWTYVPGAVAAGLAQKAVHFTVYEVIDPDDNDVPPARLSGTEDEVLVFVGAANKQTSSAGYTFVDNFFADKRVYQVELGVTNDNGLDDPTPQVVRWYFDLDAPDPLIGLSPTSHPELSMIELNWDTPASLKSGQSFRAYNVYKRLLGDNVWQHVGTVENMEDSFYRDWYAGNDVRYEYRVTIVTTKTGAGVELESGDDSGNGNTCEAQLQSDVWMFVGYDRDAAHILELPVNDEDHNRVIQQEEFEPLGSARKVIIRGFVLGNEGSITLIFENIDVQSPTDYQVMINETVLGRRLFDYLTFNKGPHILKSPFGDVWDVQFEGPQMKWLATGHLQITINWIETGNTSQVSI